ncbi:AAA family ATPase [Carnobacterium maltaromaticum]|uniref:Nuclease SbcCD subunit C n=1 Tax=Carnobacterium maltaromaticum TaxID=2751 RepID=A0AAW9JNQ8_CARML|nr:AAA family ATPase [Carnobacterium maltaromaticum]MDZ5758092.1 AAA family ATPase [Carnobacterium maltaromaticum]
MKKIKLIKLTIQNFKGLTDLELDLNGENMQIFADNEVGKTTIYDSFLWVLFNKDSLGKTDFQWKPTNIKEDENEGKQTKVSVLLSVDGSEIEFSKTRYDAKTTKRGTTDISYTTKTSYSIDGIELKTEKQFNERVAEIIDEATFRRLTSSNHVMEVMKMGDRRAMLFDLFGNLSDEEIINSKKELAPLIGIIGNHSADEATTKIKQEIKNLQKTLKEIPSQIKGIQSIKPDIEDLDKEALTARKITAESDVKNAEDILMSIRNGSAVTEIRASLQLKVAEIEEERAKFNARQNVKLDGIRQGKEELISNYHAAQDAVRNEETRLYELKQNASKEQNTLDQLNKELDSVSVEWKTINSEVFPTFDEHQLTCESCGQELQPDKIKEHKANYKAKLEAFNINKAQQLEANNAKGSELYKNVEQQQEIVTDLMNRAEDNKVLENLLNKAFEEKTKVSDVTKTIEELQAATPDFETTKDYEKLVSEKEAITVELKKLQESAEIKMAEQASFVSELKQKLNTINEEIAKFGEVERQDNQIQALADEEKLLASQKGALEQQLFLLEEFTRTKVALLEDSINKHFGFVKWKLFEDQKNDGLKEICEPVNDLGVYYSKGFSTSRRIKAGLDIVNTLMKKEGISVPVFIDNAESVTDMYVVDTQIIELIVSKGDKKLRIEKDGAA